MVGLLITLVLVVRRVKGAILIGILGSTVLAIIVEAIAKVGPSFVDGKPNPKGWSLNVPALPDDGRRHPGPVAARASSTLLGSWQPGWCRWSR